MTLFCLPDCYINFNYAEGFFKIVRVDFYHETSLTTIDKDAVEIEDAGFSADLQFCACAKGTCATDQITSMLLSNVNLTGMDLLYTQLSGKIFCGNFTVTMHEHDKGFFIFVLHDQCLNYPMLRYVKALRCLMCPSMLYKWVEMGNERNLFLTKYANRLSDRIIRFSHYTVTLSNIINNLYHIHTYSSRRDDVMGNQKIYIMLTLT